MPNPKRFRIGVDLGGTKIEAAVLDRDGGIVVRQRMASPRDDYGATVDAVSGLIRAVEDDAGGAGSVGVAIPGMVSPATGLVKHANSTWLMGRPLEQDLARALDRPVKLANDANCFALSEAVDGAAKDAKVVFGGILGTGCGAGIVIDRKVVEGANAIAGEWGHIPVPWPDDSETPPVSCYCGRENCLELYLSGTGLARDHALITGHQIKAEEIAALDEAGDAEANATFERFERRLAKSLSMIVTILDPDVIVLGGGLSNIDRIYRTVPQLMGDLVFGEELSTRLARHVHGDSSGVRGAAWLWDDEETAG